MAKAVKNTQQGTFSFFDEVEKVDPKPKPTRHVLKPPEQIELQEPTPSEPPTEMEKLPPDAEAAESEIPVKFPVEESIGETAVSDLPVDYNEPDRNEEETALLVPVENSGNETKNPRKKPVSPASATKKNSGIRGRRSVKENSLAAVLVQIPEDEVLFQKHYYSMREVTTLFRENHSLIRYWESEFDVLQPKKNAKGDRFFRPMDIKNLALIYDLLRRRKFTIEGAKEFMKNNRKADEKFAAIQSLKRIKDFFLELKASL